MIARNCSSLHATASELRMASRTACRTSRTASWNLVRALKQKTLLKESEWARMLISVCSCIWNACVVERAWSKVKHSARTENIAYIVAASVSCWRKRYQTFERLLQGKLMTALTEGITTYAREVRLHVCACVRFVVWLKAHWYVPMLFALERVFAQSMCRPEFTLGCLAGLISTVVITHNAFLAPYSPRIADCWKLP